MHSPLPVGAPRPPQLLPGDVRPPSLLRGGVRAPPPLSGLVDPFRGPPPLPPPSTGGLHAERFCRMEGHSTELTDWNGDSPQAGWFPLKPSPVASPTPHIFARQVVLCLKGACGSTHCWGSVACCTCWWVHVGAATAPHKAGVRLQRVKALGNVGRRPHGLQTVTKCFATELPTPPAVLQTSALFLCLYVLLRSEPLSPCIQTQYATFEAVLAHALAPCLAPCDCYYTAAWHVQTHMLWPLLREHVPDLVKWCDLPTCFVAKSIHVRQLVHAMMRLLTLCMFACLFTHSLTGKNGAPRPPLLPPPGGFGAQQAVFGKWMAPLVKMRYIHWDQVPIMLLGATVWVRLRSPEGLDLSPLDVLFAEVRHCSSTCNRAPAGAADTRVAVLSWCEGCRAPLGAAQAAGRVGCVCRIHHSRCGVVK